MSEKGNSLVDEIEATLRTLGLAESSFRRLVGNAALTVLEQVKDRFVESADSRFWWEHLRFSSFGVRFVDDKPCSRLVVVVPQDTGTVWCIVENWEGDDLLVYEGTIAAAQQVLSDDFKLEYYIVPRDLGWLVCENHHGYLIAVGNPPIDHLRAIVERNPGIVLDAGFVER